MSHNQVKATDLQKLGIFRGLTEAQQTTLADQMIRRNYTPGQFIFLEGDESVGLWFVMGGKVKIIKQSTTGRLQGLCLVNSGKCFGGCPMFDADTNPANAQALNDVTLAVIPRERVQQLVYQDVSIATFLLEVYNKRIQLLARLGECLGTWPVTMRINDCLIAHARQETDHPVVQLTHEEIAVLAGTAREVVTRHLSELEHVDVIHTSPGSIKLLNMAALESQCISGHIAKT